MEPRFMNDDERAKKAWELMEEACSCLCWIGCDVYGLRRAGFERPELVEKSIKRLDKAITSLEKHRNGGAL